MEHPEYLKALATARKQVEERNVELQKQIDDVLRRERRTFEQTDPPAQIVGRKGPFGNMPADAIASYRIRAAVPRIAPLVVREYAAPRPGSGEKSTTESDTVLWQPVIVLPDDGKTTLTFNVGNARGGYDVIVAGHTLDGRIGAVRGFVPIAPPEATAPSGQPTGPAPVPPPPPVPPPAPPGPNKR